MKKWTITFLAALASSALALTVHRWTPWLLSFAVHDKERIESLNTLAELVSKLVTWPVSAILFIFGLWQKRIGDSAPRETGGISVDGNAKIVGDVFSGNKTTVQGDQVAGDKVVTGGGDFVKGNKIIYEASAPALISPFQLPPPPSDFTGRTAELAELRDAIKQGGAHIFGLRGQGGIGKTALALRLAAELAPSFPDAQIYLDLKGVSDRPLTTAEAMSHVLRTFHPQATLPEALDDLRPLYLNLLHSRRVLLLMDNAKDAAQMQPLMAPKGCTLLITSRIHFHLPGIKAKNLEALSQGHAIELLLKIAPRIDKEAEAIAKLCAYLPQALRLAAAAIAERPDLSPAEFREKLAEEKQRLKLLSGDNESVEASIAFSYNLLDTETQRRWRTLGVFPDTFDLIAAASVLELELDPTRDTLSHLLRFSMLEWDEKTNRYRLHDLMRAFARATSGAALSKLAARNHAAHYASVLDLTDDFYQEGGSAQVSAMLIFGIEMQNIQAAQSWTALNWKTDAKAAELCYRYPTHSAVSLMLHPRQAITWLESALAAARTLRRPDSEMRVLSNLGYAWDSVGEYENALNSYKDALALSHQLKDRETEGRVLGNIGSTFDSLHKSNEAIQYHKQALEVAREIGDPWLEGNSLNNLGVSSGRMGDYEEAAAFYEDALHLAESTGNRLGEAAALGNMGIAHAALGEHERAINCFRRQLDMSSAMGDLKGQSISHRNMSVSLFKIGERDSAISHAQEALRIKEAIDDPEAAEVAEQIERWQR